MKEVIDKYRSVSSFHGLRGIERLEVFLVIPPFRTANSSLMVSKYTGNYSPPGSSPIEYHPALLEVEDDILWLRSLAYGNMSALLRLDQLGWFGDKQPIYYSSSRGSVLAPSDVEVGAKFRIFAEGLL